ncbi:formate dehydrogenase accessory sulfurtransferase FdhD [Polaromonas sp. CG_9.7]|uniref:formate dehydrogenase accessory sulfurtransferase FdhD n=1 Tax=unclassified Polaromonas TaxID=2638319 RepID=UPI00351C8340
MNEAPTLPTPCGSLPPEGALRLQPGKAGSAALAGAETQNSPALAVSDSAEGALRLQPGKAGSAALAGAETQNSPALAVSDPAEGALRLRPGKAGSAALAGAETQNSPALAVSDPAEGALRLQPGKAGSAALAGAEADDSAAHAVSDAAASTASGLVFYTTGRLTSEMVIKSAQMGVPVVVSRSGITQMGHQVAQLVGLCAIGRATNKRFLCYTHAERLRLEPGLLVAASVSAGAG